MGVTGQKLSDTEIVVSDERPGSSLKWERLKRLRIGTFEES